MAHNADGEESMSELRQTIADERILEQLARAEQQYEAYLKLTELASTFSDELRTTTAAPLYDWSHPLGLVIKQ